MAQFPGLIAKQQDLLKERGVIVSKIRGLPGLENFLLPLLFDTLRSAASNGPVIIINHCKWRSDIIIISHDSPPSLITRPYSFFGWANGLKDKLLGMRQLYGLGSKEYARALIFVLKDLYELIGGPVIKKIPELGIPESRAIPSLVMSHIGFRIPSFTRNGSNSVVRQQKAVLLGYLHLFIYVDTLRAHRIPQFWCARS
jgi:hypothetical protein